MNFYYELTNADHLTDQQIAEIERGLESKSFVCQQEFEKSPAIGHQINVLADADDEAFVSRVEFDGEGNVTVELDCCKVVL